ncbi:fumarylacetoacetate hydrolase family protein [Streptomyces sp. NPDC052077]|uniref:2-keto-4-pentenoate hydratase n=1 Tax=Streptomyces sp. NPDC052077 TaxID=3154757 RepID=UPI003448F48D
MQRTEDTPRNGATARAGTTGGTGGATHPDDVAAVLDEAQRRAGAVPQFEEGAFDLAGAYRAQEALLALRCARGERPVGIKLGFTSHAKMAQMGVDELIVGRLTDAMRVDDGGGLDMGGLIHPRVEPEVAFLLGADLRPGEEPRVTAVAPALEVIDSRYQDFRFSLVDVVADNASSAAFTVGAWTEVPDGLADLGVRLDIDGTEVRTGSTAAILGNPLDALAAAAVLAGRYGIAVPAGTLVLAGAATAAAPLPAGSTVRVSVDGLGSASLISGGGRG